MRRFPLLLALVLVAAVAAGCGGGGSAPEHPTPAPTAAPGRTAAKGDGARSLAPPPARGHFRGPVPILMYHVIAAAPATGTPYPELWVPPEAFAAQMKALKRAGYHGVTLSQMWDAWHGGPGLPRHPVVVSFDDGYTSQFRSAAPVLHRLGWPGVINLEVKNLHVAGGMNAREVRGLLARGWELASHTRTHPDVTTLDAAGLEREIAGSRAVLRRRFGVPVAFFCYPAGRYDAAAVAAVRAAGYHGATTTEPGVAQPGGDPYTMPRVRVQPQDTPEGLLRQIRSMGG